MGSLTISLKIPTRLLAFSNGDLQALYDRSDGFYRRQLVLTTKEKPVDRADDPDLAEKMKAEAYHHVSYQHYQMANCSTYFCCKHDMNKLDYYNRSTNPIFQPFLQYLLELDDPSDMGI